MNKTQRLAPHRWPPHFTQPLPQAGRHPPTPSALRSTLRPRSAALGMALIEAMVATALLGMGLAAATRLSLQTLQTATQTRQRTVAQTLGMEAVECLLSGRMGCPAQTAFTHQGITYTVQSRAIPGTQTGWTDLSVSVHWTSGYGPQAENGPAALAGWGGGNTTVAIATRREQLFWQTRRDEVPVWVGVSLP